MHTKREGERVAVPFNSQPGQEQGASEEEYRPLGFEPPTYRPYTWRALFLSTWWANLTGTGELAGILLPEQNTGSKPSLSFSCVAGRWAGRVLCQHAYLLLRSACASSVFKLLNAQCRFRTSFLPRNHRVSTKLADASLGEIGHAPPAADSSLIGTFP